jgi:hypothetical protein
MRLNIRPLVLGYAALSIAAPASAQLAITGRITDDTGRPLTSAQVLIEGTAIATGVDESGAYRLVVTEPRPGMTLLVRSIA